MLSQRMVLPTLPAIAALSAGNLGALLLPPGLCRLYIAEDADPAGHARQRDSSPAPRRPGSGQWYSRPCSTTSTATSPLRRRSPAAHLRPQLAPEDVRFLMPAG